MKVRASYKEYRIGAFFVREILYRKIVSNNIYADITYGGSRWRSG